MAGLFDRLRALLGATGQPADAPRHDPTGGGAGDRLIDRLLGHFAERHQTLINRVMQFVAVPLLLWGGLGLLRALPVPSSMQAVAGIDWALLAAIPFCLAALVLAPRLGWALIVLVGLILVLAALYEHYGALPLWQPALVALGAGWVAWLIGRRVEGRPRDLGEILFDLLMAPVWIVARVLHLLRIGY